MKSFFAFLVFSILLCSCKSRIRQQEDSLYSRHLQRHVALTITTTPMPDDKTKMNVLFLIAEGKAEIVEVKAILDSLNKNRLIQPVTIVSFEAKPKEQDPNPKNLDYAQLLSFAADELYPYAKKKSVLRKFNSVAVCGLGEGSSAAFDIAFNNDEKFTLCGIIDPIFSGTYRTDLPASRKRPDFSLWINNGGADTATAAFAKTIKDKKGFSGIQTIVMQYPGKMKALAEFLVWSFPIGK